MTSIALPGILGPVQRGRAIDHLRSYFSGTSFSGSFFDVLGGGGDRSEVANVVTEADLLSLATLSVPVGGHAARQLLTAPLGTDVTRLLAQIPTDLSIATPEGRAFLGEGKPAWELWNLVRTVGQKAPQGNAFGQVRTSKLLARKRPHLIPIYDAVVAKQFGLPGSADQWTVWSELFADGKFVAHLGSIQAAVDEASHISLLRVLDVVVWMEGQASATTGEIQSD